ncbi:MAG: Holliday junction resolvase RuvX [Pseudobutyrivibrio sp.]|nr:Holliday junction resolvase RuvX [Pseudobutyrivibrio sp.]
MADSRVLGLDYGTKTVGVAVSDPLLLMAQELETIKRDRPNALRHTLVRIKEICEEYNIKKIVLGYPLNMDDTEGFRCEDTIAFKELLQKRIPDIPIILLDERLTTMMADDILEESGVHKKNRKQFIDQIAAAIILQDYLDRKED